MIIRKEADGTLLVIGQTDHSRLVGQLAAHWGNETFAAPAPWESVVRAATFHDYGWLRYETSPLVRAATGEPFQFLEVPLDATQLGAYQWSLDWMADVDRYAGLIVSMHRTGLWRGRYGTIAHPSSYDLESPSPEIEAFIARNEAWQARAREGLDADAVWTNYRLMQVWDLLGLYFCCQEPSDDRIEPVPVRYGGKDAPGVRLRLTPIAGGRVACAPYPFATHPCRVQLARRRLRARTFEDLAAFRRAWFQADMELREFELVDAERIVR
ncbi:MAG TPA: DUF3891 family protein [Candidatus Binatia bacterium]|jgi:hypothetical protein|nr:DUF3891 family protein [Candidatus Binatia bacterium]